MSKLAWVSIYNVFLIAATVFLITNTGNWLWVFLFVVGAASYKEDDDN